MRTGKSDKVYVFTVSAWKICVWTGRFTFVGLCLGWRCCVDDDASCYSEKCTHHLPRWPVYARAISRLPTASTNSSAVHKLFEAAVPGQATLSLAATRPEEEEEEEGEGDEEEVEE